MYISGINPTSVRTSTEGPEFQVGTIGWNQTSEGPKGFMYVKGDGTGVTADAYVVDIDGSTFVASMSTTTTTAPGTGAGKAVGVARAAIAANGFGWVQVYGYGLVQVSASCAAYTIINSTATAGQLDDDATAGAEVIDGIVLDAARAASAGTAAAFIQWPKVGRTL
jgi:hypothetical protein